MKALDPCKYIIIDIGIEGTSIEIGLFRNKIYLKFTAGENGLILNNFFKNQNIRMLEKRFLYFFNLTQPHFCMQI